MIGLTPLLVCWLTSTAVAAPAGGGEVEGHLQAGAEGLASIEQEIDQARAAREANEKQRRDLARRLHKVEGELAARRDAVARLDQATTELTTEVAQLRQRLDASRKAVARERRLLAARLRQLHEEGAPPPAMALFTARLDPWALLLDTRYQEALAEATGKRIDHLTREQRRMQAVRQELAARQLRLDEERAALTRARAQLAKKVAEQRSLLARRRREGQTIEERIVTLEADRKRLRAMVEELAARRQAVAGQGQIVAARGHLPWPILGDVVGFFGVAPEGGGPPANGIRIRPAAQGKVRAVWDGDVIFADWFEGYGLLLIVDHGSGYYSLYGHVSGLLAAAGDHVHQGDAIADTTGPDADPLYFEMRKDGRPIDPLHWLQGLAAVAASDD